MVEISRMGFHPKSHLFFFNVQDPSMQNYRKTLESSEASGGLKQVLSEKANKFEAY